MSNACPNCRLTNPTAAELCDCGYSFTTGRVDSALQLRSRYQTASPLRSIRFIAGTIGVPFIYYGLLPGDITRAEIVDLSLSVGASCVIGALLGLSVSPSGSRSAAAILLAPIISCAVILGGLVAWDFSERRDLSRALACGCLLSIGIFITAIPAAGAAALAQRLRFHWNHHATRHDEVS